MTHPYARELGDFLRARRARLRPRDVGLEPGGRRKVAGLRPGARQTADVRRPHPPDQGGVHADG
ncbi:hypothetical protein AB0C31_13195, partial [Actinoplanes philippinensis]